MNPAPDSNPRAPRVLVVEDDAAIRRGLGDALRASGYDVVEAADGESGVARSSDGAVALVLLDVMLPGLDGFGVLERIRAARPVLPVIFLTARGSEEDRVRGLRRGADDYVVKPFSTTELLARVEAVLRRTSAASHEPAFAVAGIAFDLARAEARLASGELVELSEREAALLSFLAVHRDRVVPRDELLRRVWGVDPRGLHTRAIDMLITRLRERLGDDPAEPRVIATVRGRGYKLGT